MNKPDRLITVRHRWSRHKQRDARRWILLGIWVETVMLPAMG